MVGADASLENSDSVILFFSHDAIACTILQVMTVVEQDLKQFNLEFCLHLPSDQL